MISQNKTIIMQKILVPTDFSDNSKAGLRFAIQLASQHPYQLTFFHCYHMNQLTSSDSKEESDDKSGVDRLQTQLNNFVDTVYNELNATQDSTTCIVQSSVAPDASIRDYATKNGYSYICISTRGAGKFDRVFGTNTSNLISFSDVPVIAVPKFYTAKKITDIIYASDLNNLEVELVKVVDFAKPLEAEVELLHITSPIELETNSETIEAAVKTFSKYDIKLHVEKPNPSESLVSNLEAAIEKSNPSMMIMFTQQNRTFFEKLFLSSKTEEFSFNLKVPLLDFSKL